MDPSSVPLPWVIAVVGALISVIVYQNRRAEKKSDEQLKREQDRADKLARILNSFTIRRKDYEKDETNLGNGE